MLLRRLYFIGLFSTALLLPYTVPAAPPTEAKAPDESHSAVTHGYAYSADIIRNTYESQLYTLPAFKAGHYGLRMYRQTLDDKYAAAIWSDMARVANRLNYFAADVHTPEQIYLYSQRKLARYSQDPSIRAKLRYTVSKHMPEYLYLGVDLLGSMARANEYGLKHRNDKQLRNIIRRYDFTKYATNPEMIRAWAAQLANQVFWLRQLGEQDVVDTFIESFRATYPDKNDEDLSPQQFENKLYGMTHIIFADSEYYQHLVSEQKYQWIYDYLRRNIDTILQHAKEDVIAEVGISFLLAGLDDDPVVEQTRQAIVQAMDKQAGMIPSNRGGTNIVRGEHRNVLAIMLLDWQGVNEAPTINKQPAVFADLPFGLEALNTDVASDAMKKQ